MKSVINLVNTAKKNGLYPDIPIVDNVPSDASLVMGGVEYFFSGCKLTTQLTKENHG